MKKKPRVASFSIENAVPHVIDRKWTVFDKDWLVIDKRRIAIDKYQIVFDIDWTVNL